MTRAPRLYLYVPSFAGGGAERVFVRLANHYAAAGVDVGFIVNTDTGPLRELLNREIPLVVLNQPRAIRALPKLAAFLKSEQPDVLISAMTGVNLTAILARFLSGAPTRVITSERNQVSTLMRRWSKPRRWMFLLALRLLYGRADHLTAVTEDVALDVAYLSGVDLDRITVVHNPVPEAHEIDRARARPVPHPWLADDIPVIIAIGRLVPQKGFHTLLHALARVHDKSPARLIILGDGPLLADLQHEAERVGLAGAVDFPGFVSNRFDYLVHASLFVLSSDTEGFPNALLEALACDLPVVSTDCAGGGPRVILGAGADDAIVPVGDAAGMAEAINRELGRPRRRGEFFARTEPFSMSNTADTFLDLVAAVQRK